MTTDNISSVTLSNAVNANAGPFYFFGPVVARGTIQGQGQPDNTIIIQDQASFDTLQLIGPLTNVVVTGPNIEPGTTVTVLSVTPSSRTVTLSQPLLRDSRPGSYAYTFGHANPYTPPGP